MKITESIDQLISTGKDNDATAGSSPAVALLGFVDVNEIISIFSTTRCNNDYGKGILISCWCLDAMHTIYLTIDATYW